MNNAAHGRISVSPAHGTPSPSWAAAAPTRREHIEFCADAQPSLQLRALDLSPHYGSYVAREHARGSLVPPQTSARIRALQLRGGPAERVLHPEGMGPELYNLFRLHPVLDTMGPRTMAAMAKAVKKHADLVKEQAYAQQQKLILAMTCVEQNDLEGFERIMGIGLQEYLQGLKGAPSAR